MGICNSKTQKKRKEVEGTAIPDKFKQQKNDSNIKGNQFLNDISQQFSAIEPKNSNTKEISGPLNSNFQLSVNQLNSVGEKQLNPEIDNTFIGNPFRSKVNEESKILPTLENSQLNINAIKPFEFFFKDKRIILPFQMKEKYDFHQFQFLGSGSGACNCVFQLKETGTENLHAIKRLEFKDSAELFNITKEINILYRLLPYRNIVNIKQNYSDIVNSAIYIAMEKGKHSLKEYIKQSENGAVSSIILNQIIRDITFALVYSYRESVVHCDIKPENIIVFENSQKKSELFNSHDGQPSEENLIFKLKDFSSATLKISKKKNDEKPKDNALYAAPEVKQAKANEEEEEEEEEENEKIENENTIIFFEQNKKTSQIQNKKYLNYENYEKADVFSFGMTLLNCCGIKNDVLFKLNKVEKEEDFEKEIIQIMDLLAKKYNSFLDVIQGMIKYKKMERFSLQDICKTMHFEVPEVKYKKKKREIEQVQEATNEKLPILPSFNIAQPIEYDFEHIKELIKKKLSEVNQSPFYDLKILEVHHKRYKEMRPQNDIPFCVTVKYLDSNEIYHGGFENGLRHLNGLLIFPDGSIYQGNFEHNAASGKGIKIYSNGNFFNGYFLKGSIEGGILFYSDGRKYIGEFKNDVPNGNGAEIFPDGTIFEGNFENGLKNENGLLKIRDEIFEVEYGKGELKRRIRKCKGGLKSTLVLIKKDRNIHQQYFD